MAVYLNMAFFFRKHRHLLCSSHYTEDLKMIWLSFKRYKTLTCVLNILTELCNLQFLYKIILYHMKNKIQHSMIYFPAILHKLDSWIFWFVSAEINQATKLTHWGWDKMDTIFQVTYWSGYSWMKIYEFWLTFHWILLPGGQLTLCQHWFR